ncbi:sigma-54-dependent Fis family transcriptional regulator [Sporomusa acidovorans]|uniref:Acetoin dehydrogenase operon transcriptional activator AcoR n=1 Tax=Sporomusa acidovorans (strain ATCC 49682 / DSM 3132 / Mol) TaxID=1123286 RepID=A0ABZ3IYC3_SPOA4|nr:sigma 54-interacting transcriptional regulator [Sporomusa acidovorans]OZC16814.1 acetoin dehydrogenase operon transcriptional activator AcoR [Sporomusa acidovorans DSM 3132]SDF79044.1 Transcriptional regulator containing PAS, AAA-type ATPase, and DNA-binding Fis domains [Sporomusa acidovorans]
MDFKSRWKELQETKKKFLQDNLDPRSCFYVDSYVAESWIRSQAMGVSPYANSIKERLDAAQIVKVLADNCQLMDITISLFSQIKLKELAIASQHALYLFDKNGIVLIHEGDLLAISNQGNSLRGVVWNEKTMGTCAHTLSMQLKRPIHLLGPEHYCVAFDRSNTSAAPILDEDGELLATLVLSQHLNDRYFEEHFIDFSSHALGIVTAMAAAIETKIRLKDSYEKLKTVNHHLKTAHHMLATTLAVIDEGIITIDAKGDIIHLNTEGRRILGLDQKQTININISKYLSKQSRVIDLIADGENTDIEENFYIDGKEQTYLVNIRIVYSDDLHEVDGAVLKLQSTEKMNAMVTSRSGATASFSFASLIGESKEFKKAIAQAQRFANTPENILINGESGTGKELFAQAIHNKYRPEGPFIAVNCAALPRELIESELFGYEGGSFTGADRSGRPGKIELAHGGTLFLDEIGDMPLELQAVLLRVLEDKQVMRIGGRRNKKVDFRLVSATNKELYQMVQDKLFREDLYFRLSVLTINLPPLRQRGNDVEILSEYFIEKYCRKVGWAVPAISPAAWKRMRGYNWPGNVRQLEHAVVYAVNAAQNEMIEPEDLPAMIISCPAKITVRGKIEEVYTLEVIEKLVIVNALHKTKSNISKTADLLGIGKSTLYRKIKDYDINMEEDF